MWIYAGSSRSALVRASSFISYMTTSCQILRSVTPLISLELRGNSNLGLVGVLSTFDLTESRVLGHRFCGFTLCVRDSNQIQALAS